MRYLAITVLAIVGLLELVLRVAFVLVMVVSVIGLMFFAMYGDDHDLSELFRPVCFSLAKEMVVTPRARLSPTTGEDARAALATAWARNEIDDGDFYDGLDKLLARER